MQSQNKQTSLSNLHQGSLLKGTLMGRKLSNGQAAQDGPRENGYAYGFGSDNEELGKRLKEELDDSKGMHDIRPSILDNSSHLNHSMTSKKSYRSADEIRNKEEKDDPHWPEVFMDTLDKPINQGDQPDAIKMDEAVSSFKFLDVPKEEIWNFIKAWKFLEQHDDVRFQFAAKNGGKLPENDKIMKKIRGIAKEVIMSVGKKILSGNFNLTTVSFPIKAMVPKSHLENIALGTCYFPLYMNLAAESTDPLQRFKYYIVSCISYYYLTNSFAKPLNPILGETMHGHYNDGSRVFLEQTSHHPPISYIYVDGPKNSYKYYGPSIFSASAGLNSLTLVVKGWRKVHFKNPDQEIHNTFPNEVYDGTFWGSCVHETLGNMEFVDKANGISCELKFGKVKKKPTDYLEGEIKVNGQVVSKVTGTYLGWIEIDGNRYFDYRHLPPYKFMIERSRLGSDFAYRPDLYFLQLGDVPRAQKEKENLEVLQRTDAKLRKAHAEKTGKGTKH